MRGTILSRAVDHPPVILIATSVACHMAGVKQGVWATHSDVLADTLIEFADMIECDGIYVTRDNLVVHEAMGGGVTTPEDDEQMGHEPVLSNLRDFEKLAIPDPWKAPGMRTVLAAAKRAVAKAGDRYYVMANIDCGPFSTAANLRGVQNFLMDIALEDPVLISEYLDFCTDLVVTYGRAMQNTGVHGIQYGDSTASLVNSEMFEQFALPYLELSMEQLAQANCDMWLHICGKTDHLLPMLKDLNMQLFEVDAMVPMARAQELVGGSVVLKGGIDTMFLQDSSAEEVYQATRELLLTCGSTGLIISAGCMVPRLTPLENLRAMTRACRDSGN